MAIADATQLVIRDAEQLIQRLEQPRDAGTRADDDDLVRGVVLSLKMLLPLYARVEAMPSPLVGLLSGTPLAMLTAVVPAPFLLFLFFVGKGRGWW